MRWGGVRWGALAFAGTEKRRGEGIAHDASSVPPSSASSHLVNWHDPATFQLGFDWGFEKRLASLALELGAPWFEVQCNTY